MEDDYLIMYKKDWEKIKEIVNMKNVACIYVVERYVKYARIHNEKVPKYRVTDNPNYNYSNIFTEGEIIFKSIKDK